MKRVYLLPITLVLLASANAAFACGAKSSASASTTVHAKPTFTGSNTNHDGYVSRNEAQKAGVTDYSFADKNADGLLDADFHCTSPLDNRIDRATYVDRSSPNSRTIAGFDFVAMQSLGDRVFVVYEGRSTDGHQFRDTEILTVRGGRVVDVEVYFGWSIPHRAVEGGFVARGLTASRRPTCPTAASPHRCVCYPPALHSADRAPSATRAVRTRPARAPS
jgi:hypothetical protein